MLTVYWDNGIHGKHTIMEIDSPINGKQLMETLSKTYGIDADKYFFKNNGRLVELDDFIYNGNISLEQKLCGGKGGFGSMLRAIGAQIEKTTNREACRDLSGRRLRDINEEKRLKSWLEKQANRDEEAAERKKKKLERLCAEPKHEFKDKDYEQQRFALTERVEDAVEVGFAAASTLAIKRTADKKAKTNVTKKKKMMLDLDEIDSDDLNSSDESGDEKQSERKMSAANSKSDTENSSNTSLDCPETSNEVNKQARNKETEINSSLSMENSSDFSNGPKDSSNKNESKSVESKSADDTSR